MGLCKLPWVDVFNPESATRTGTDIYINPASQEIYAEYFNGMLGTELTWEEIFARTDRDINLQRVMNVLRFGRQTASHDWIPDRAIGPTDDLLYEAEQPYNDAEVARITGQTPAAVAGLPTAGKRASLMAYRKDELSKLIKVYYAERGWNGEGIPFIDTLEELGLWPFLSPAEQEAITELTAS
jgi:aldehyde:ferredoxin oxidoreductase